MTPYGKHKGMKKRNDKMNDALAQFNKELGMDKMTPQQKYNFLHDDGYYDESDTGAMTKEELKRLKKLGN